MNKKIALVTNVLDFVGPPAVKALLEGGYNVVVAQDPAFQDSHVLWKRSNLGEAIFEAPSINHRLMLNRIIGKTFSLQKSTLLNKTYTLFFRTNWEKWGCK